jgi:prenyltransferase beta subunit
MTGSQAITQHLPANSVSEAVIQWLRTMRVSATEYKMNETADATIFTSCFALFILHLFRETDKFTEAERSLWVAHVQSYQDMEDGYFKPEVQLHADQERSWHQLTCFCLSALALLNAEPRFPLRFLGRWETPESIHEYLVECGCHTGASGSGNKAMFLAIFLTWEYERTHDERYRSCLEEWFAFHNAHQNAQGFWGRDWKSHSLHGLQNGLHQFMIYFYWQRRLPRLERIIDVALSTQDRDGFFAPTPGGGGCYDYDAIHTLVRAYRISEHRRPDIEACLRRARAALSSNQNHDGGFCLSSKPLTTCLDVVRHGRVYFSGRHPYLWYYRLRRVLSAFLRRKSPIQTGWTCRGRTWTDSNLWDTWFRCLSLAEIETIIPSEHDTGFKNARFHRMVGFGHGCPVSANRDGR